MRSALCKMMCAGLLVWSGAGWVQGQEGTQTEPAEQPTQVSVKEAGKVAMRSARLAYFSGDLQVQRADNTGGDAAALNMPLSEGTRLITGDDGRAEIEFEDGSVARMTPGTVLVLDVLELHAKAIAQTQMSVLSGTAYFELRATPAATWNIFAGGVAASPVVNTSLRVSLGEAQATFAVLLGAIAARSAEVSGFSANVKAGESLRPDSEDASRYFLNQEIAQNDWDNWSQARDQTAVESAASRTVARDGYASGQGYGWSDLDANGTWYTTPNADGGADELWQPATADAESFDPYGEGAWVFSGGGYVWASGYAWGWLPYHCGRWLWLDGLGWVWRPSRFCGTIGFGGDAGYGGYLIDEGRHRHRPVERPIPKPGGFHPILRVHSPTAPPVRTNPIYATPVKLATTVATPLLPLSVSGGGGGNLEPLSALSSDFVVDSASRRPITGIAAQPVSSGVRVDTATGGWMPRQSNPRTGSGGIVVAPTSATNHHEQAVAGPTRTQAAPPSAPAAPPHPAAPVAAPSATAPAPASGKPK